MWLNLIILLCKNLNLRFSTWLTHLILRFLYIFGRFGQQCGTVYCEWFDFSSSFCGSRQREYIVERGTSHISKPSIFIENSGQRDISDHDAKTVGNKPEKFEGKGEASFDTSFMIQSHAERKSLEPFPIF